MTASQLDRIAALTTPVERAQEAAAYIARGRESLTTARRLRDTAIADLLSTGQRITDIAAQTGVSVSHVKLIKRVMEGNR